MNQDPKEQFEKSFQVALKASLSSPRAGDAMRERLRGALAAESARAPRDVDELELQEFEDAVSRAVAESQQWACEDCLALRVESAVSQEAGRELLSERAVLADPSAQGARARYLNAFRSSLKASQRAIVAPASCRARIEAALQAESAQARTTASGPTANSKVVPLPISERPTGRPLWKRALATGASLAAGFALLFVSLLGGADKALAETVRKDHLRCCGALSGAPMKSCASYRSELYGELPAPPVKSWTLVASRMCHDEQGHPMIHNVYFQGGKKLSVHFLPPANEDRQSSRPHAIAGGDFPVLAWQSGGWTVTACSQDLDMETLVAALGVEHP